MAEQAGTIVSQVLRRTRDASGMATSRAHALLFISNVQQVMNAITDLVFQTDTVVTTAKQQVYDLGTLTPDSIQWQDVKEHGSNRSLVPTDPWKLFYHEREWTRTNAAKSEVFGLLGIDLGIIHPATTEAGSIDVTYTKLTSDLTVAPSGSGDPESNTLEMPDDVLPGVLDLTEALLYLRQRQFSAAQTSVTRFVNRVQGYRRVAKV